MKTEGHEAATRLMSRETKGHLSRHWIMGLKRALSAAGMQTSRQERVLLALTIRSPPIQIPRVAMNRTLLMLMTIPWASMTLPI